jgi:hypothetical protein
MTPRASIFALLCFTLCGAVGVHGSETGNTAAREALSERALAFDLACCTPPPGWTKVGASNLDEQRGGFDLPSGLTLSLGIERLVSINGQTISQNSFNIANVSSMTADEARQASAAFGTAHLVQNGSGNFAALPGGAGTFVQNSLDGQTIGTQTIISANVNSATMLKDLNFNASVRDAGLRGIPVH